MLNALQIRFKQKVVTPLIIEVQGSRSKAVIRTMRHEVVLVLMNTKHRLW